MENPIFRVLYTTPKQNKDKLSIGRVIDTYEKSGTEKKVYLKTDKNEVNQTNKQKYTKKIFALCKNLLNLKLLVTSKI